MRKSVKGELLGRNLENLLETKKILKPWKIENEDFFDINRLGEKIEKSKHDNVDNHQHDFYHNNDNDNNRNNSQSNKIIDKKTKKIEEKFNRMIETSRYLLIRVYLI